MKRHDESPPLFAEKTESLNVRRKLMFAMAGSLLMQAIAPMNAVGAEKNTEGQKITEEMILDFLRKLHKIIEHDDLADLEFIEKTLNVQAVFAESKDWSDGRKDKSYVLIPKEPISGSVLKHMNGRITYHIMRPNPPEKVAGRLDVIFSEEPRQPDITIDMVGKIFGQTQIPMLSISAVGYERLTYSYSWSNHNQFSAAFTYGGEHGKQKFLERVTLFQNEIFPK
jgi:hypothetical protein